MKSLLKKILFSRLPGLAGRYRYFGKRFYFAPGAFIFDLLAEEGIYEGDLLRQIQRRVKPGGCYFDVGANIGLMSLPLLSTHPDVMVVSFEPSPNSLCYLKRTHAEADYGDRWRLVAKAVSDKPGTANFTLSDVKHGGYDGLQYTKREKNRAQVSVDVTTLDLEWLQLGKPRVDCIKMDIEGAEMAALSGAAELLKSCRPMIVMEWYEPNFKAYGVETQDLLTFSRAWNYQIIALPHLFEVNTLEHLELVMVVSGNLVLIPKN